MPAATFIGGLLCALVAGPACAQPPGPNILLNPSFEEIADGRPVSWQPSSTKPEALTLAVDDTVARSGAHSVRSVSDAPANAGTWTQAVPAEASTRYRFLMWARTEALAGARGARVQIYLLTAQGKTREVYCGPSLAGTADWRKQATTFATDPDTAQIRIVLVLTSAAGTAWYDDVSLTNIGPVQARVYPPLPIAPVNLTHTANRRPQFTWFTRPAARSYLLQYSQDPAFPEPRTITRRLDTDSFRPREDLAVGAWRWRIKAIDDEGRESEWSAPREFSIAQTDYDEIRWREDLGHPRLYFTAADLPALQRKFANDDVFGEGWRALLQAADSALGAEVKPEKEVYEVSGQHGGYLSLARHMCGTLEPLGLAYQITGERKYALKARDMMLALAEYRQWVGPYFPQQKRFDPPWMSALETGELCRAVGAAYDFTYDVLTPGERDTIRTALADKGIRPLIRDWADPDGYRRLPRHQVPAGNWHMVCIGGAGVAALAILGEHPEARRWVRHARDAVRWWLNYDGGDYVLADTHNPADTCTHGPTNPNFGRDGGYVESLTYLDYAMRYVCYFGDALLRITAVDLHQYIHPEITSPPLWSWYGLGEDANRSTAPQFGDTHAAVALTDVYSSLVRHRRDPQAQFLFRTLCRRPSTVHSLLWYDAGVPGAPPPESRYAKLFQTIGWAIMRTGWEPRAKFLAIKFHQNRGHHDLGTFSLFADGERHIVDSGSGNYWGGPYGSYLRYTEAHNVVMVDGERQERTSGEVHSLVQSPAYACVTGDISAAYPYTLKAWTRRAAFIAPDYFVVTDALDSNAPRKYEWLLHPAGEFDVHKGGVDLRTLTAWSSRTLYSSTPHIAWDHSVACSGSSSLHIRSDENEDTGFWRQTIAVKPETKYRFSVRLKTDNVVGDRGARIQIWPKAASGTRTGEYCGGCLTGTNQWREITDVFETPPGTTRLEFALVLLRCTGAAWFDDISLAEADGGDNLITNPGCEDAHALTATLIASDDWRAHERDGYLHETPAKYLSLALPQPRKRALFLAVLCPHEGADRPQVTPLRADGILAARVRRPGAQDVLVLSEGKTADIAGVATDGEFAVVTRRGGEISAFALHGGTRLAGDRPLCAATQPLDIALSITPDGIEGEAHATAPARLTIWCPRGVREVLIDGAPVEFHPDDARGVVEFPLPAGHHHLLLRQA